MKELVWREKCQKEARFDVRLLRMALVLVFALQMQASGTLVGKISGSVRLEYGNSSFRLPNVSITLSFPDHDLSWRTQTDADGEFFFTNLALGNYTVQASRDTYLVRAPRLVRVRVHVDETQIVLPPFRLIPLGQSRLKELDPEIDEE